MVLRKLLFRLSICLLAVTLILPVVPFHAKAEVNGITDQLDSLNGTFARSANVVIDSSNPSNTGNDPRRATRNSTASGYFTYKTDYDIRSFTVPAYFWTDTPVVPMKFFVSGDGTNFEQVTPAVYPSGKAYANWQLFVYESFGLPAGTRYLRIQLEGDVKYWTPQVSKVIVNRNTASVAASIPSGTVLEEQRQLTLSTDTPGAAIYYKTDADTAYRLYQGPIGLTAKTAVEAYAQAEGLESSYARTFQYDWGGLTDELDHFNAAYAKSANMVIDTSNPQYLGNDPRRAVRNTVSPGWFTYKAEYDIRSFTVPAYFWTGTPVVDMKFFVSGNGTDFQQVSPDVYPSGPSSSSWQRFVYEAFGLPAGTRYLKVQLEGEDKYWTPQVSRVILNMNTASVEASIPSGSVLDGPHTLTLSTATPGAEIFFKRDSESGFSLYEGPIAIASRTSIEAYAAKNGVEPSYAKTFTYSWKQDIQIDRFGQVIKANFPEKVTGEQELQEDAARQKEYYDGLAVPEDRDSYLGLADSKEAYGLNATGFFNIQQAGGRTLMVTPEGNVFFSTGVNGLTVNETYTKVAGREAMYEWIPSFTGGFATAFRGNKDEFSYYLANRIRKSGVPYDAEAFYTEAFNRIRKWGFTTVGSWSGGYSRSYDHPHAKMLPIGGMTWAQVDGLHYFDIFADGAEQKIDSVFAEELPKYKDDPSLVGYFMENEINFHKISTVIPAAKASKVASKGKLVDLLRERYHSDVSAFNTAWNTSFSSFDELYEAELKTNTAQALEDVYAFIEWYADTLYRTFNGLFRKYDPNHLLLGDRWHISAVRNERLKNIIAEAAGKYFDVISFNYYAKSLDPTLLQDIHQRAGNKPVMITEFNYGTQERGLTGVVSAADQRERMLRYRNYVELAASLGFIVGTHWFNYVDQPATGRWWEGYTGERYNTGLVDVADRPYEEFLQGVKTTNDDIYSVLLGLREPFRHEFNDPGHGGNKSMTIPHAAVPVQIDGELDGVYDPVAKQILTAADRVVGAGGDTMQGEYHFAWDEQKLYLHATVADPTPMMNGYRNANVWRGDGIELFVGPEALEIREGLLSKDRQVIMSAGTANGQTYWHWYNTSGQQALEMAVKPLQDGGGYRLEAAVPWSALNVVPAPGKQMLFDFGFDDSVDGIVRSRQWVWNGLDGNSGNRGYWGKAELGGDPDRIKPVITVSGVMDGEDYTDRTVPVVSAEDAGSGVKETRIQLDGADWVPGTPVEAKGPHALVVTSVDYAGNTAVETVHFTVYRSTQPEVQNAAGQYGDEVLLQARLNDRDGLPVAGGSVTFHLGGTSLGSAVTDTEGHATFRYKVNVGVTNGLTEQAYGIHASYEQDETDFYRGGSADGILAVAREEAAVQGPGSQAVRADGGAVLTAQVIPQQDGSDGTLEGLPIRFIWSAVNPDGTLQPVNDTVSQSVYATNSGGVVSIQPQVPPGFYEVRTMLLANDYYASQETVSYIAVYDPAAGSVDTNGFWELPDESPFMGDQVNKIHFHGKLEYAGDAPAALGSPFRIHAEPQGRELAIDRVEWLVITPGTTYVQGTAGSLEERFTVRIYLQGTQGGSHTGGGVISLLVWEGIGTEGTPVFQALGMDVSGSYLNRTRD